MLIRCSSAAARRVVNTNRSRCLHCTARMNGTQRSATREQAPQVRSQIATHQPGRTYCSASGSDGTNGATARNGVAAEDGASPPVEGYQMPPDEIVEIVDAPLQPLLSFSPDRKLVRAHSHLHASHCLSVLVHSIAAAGQCLPSHRTFIASKSPANCTQLLQLERPPSHPPITELGRAELKLAGLILSVQIIRPACWLFCAPLQWLGPQDALTVWAP